MKKVFLSIIALVFVVSCSAPPTNREMTTTNSNMTPPPAAPALTEADATAKEKAIWDTLEKKDYDGFANMLDADMIMVENDGVYDKAGTVNGVKGFVPSDVTFSDWKFLSIDKDAGVIIYKVTFKGMMGTEAMKPQTVYASSVWVNRGGKWLAIFHQETTVETAPAMPAASKAEKTAPSPAAASSPVATSSDLTANEKAVWATFKAKNFSAFDSMLAPESIEVEQNGLSDKAATIKGVQETDLSNAVLDNWKTVKFDDDASLITYTVKIAGAKPDTSRHSTIWANRNGKWLAVFHQGTPAVAAPMPMPMAKPSPSM